MWSSLQTRSNLQEASPAESELRGGVSNGGSTGQRFDTPALVHQFVTYVGYIPQKRIIIHVDTEQQSK